MVWNVVVFACLKVLVQQIREAEERWKLSVTMGGKLAGIRNDHSEYV
jgi:hypothetical protein